MTNKELLLDALMKEYSRALHLSAELSDTDEDYNYLDGVLDGRMRSLRNIMDLIRKMTFEETPTKGITLAELYVLNNSWQYSTMFKIYEEGKEVVRMEASNASMVYGDRVIKTFDGNTIFV